MSKQLNTLTTEEIEKFIVGFDRGVHTVKQMRRTVRNRTIALLMLEAGLRVGEIVNLRIGDLTYDSRPVTSIIICVHISKTKRERQIPVSGRLSEALSGCIKSLWGGKLTIGFGLAFPRPDPSKPITDIFLLLRLSD